VSTISDPEVRLLASLGSTLQPDYINAEQECLWQGSPFNWIRKLPSRRKGKVGEQLVAGWCAAKGFDVCRTGDTEADRIISGQRVEIKMSTLWETGIYRFQQLRDQNYAHVFCLGLSPLDAHCWVIPKSEAWSRTGGQHKGKGAIDTKWLVFDPKNPPEWLSDYGGRLAQAFEIIRSW